MHIPRRYMNPILFTGYGASGRKGNPTEQRRECVFTGQSISRHDNGKLQVEALFEEDHLSPATNFFSYFASINLTSIHFDLTIIPLVTLNYFISLSQIELTDHIMPNFKPYQFGGR